MAKRINVQLERLKQKNENAFMFIDEPGMQFIFSALSGYRDQKVKQDLYEFLSMIESPKGRRWSDVEKINFKYAFRNP